PKDKSAERLRRDKKTPGDRRKRRVGAGLSEGAMLTRKGVLLALSGVLAMTGRDAPLPGPLARPHGTITIGRAPGPVYTREQKSFYLTEADLDSIRPGFHIVVNSLSIPADLKPLADISFFDDKNQPLDRLGNATPGTLSISFVLAWWDPAARIYTSYTTRVQTSPIPRVSATQAAADSGGTFTDVALGRATYKFKTALPAGYDQTKTTTLAIYATRNMSGIQPNNYYANVEYDFRPDAGTVTDVWDKTTN